MKNIFFTAVIITLLSIGSCKDNDRREDEMITPEGTVTETTIATDETADTTSRAEEDSLIEAPSP
jgi:hypothetical protein